MSQAWEVFLSASIPHPDRGERYRRYLKPEDAAAEITQAVFALATAVFTHGGRLVFGGHPSITPLIVQVAEELPKPATPHPQPVVIYQSDAYSQWYVDEVQVLRKAPYCEFHEINSGGEVASPNRPGISAPALHTLRTEMLARPNLVAMIALGGMEGILQEAVIFHSYHKSAPIYAVESTGGSARLLGDWAPSPDDPAIAGTPAAKTTREIQPADFRRQVESLSPLRELNWEVPATPYGVIMDSLLEDISSTAGNGL
jgi:hypothetical protein